MKFGMSLMLAGAGLAGSACLVGSSLHLISPPAFAAEEENPVDIIAVQIRRQGYTCDNPQGASRDIEASKPDEAVWVLTCENATYRVRLIPDMAADVERID